MKKIFHKTILFATLLIFAFSVANGQTMGPAKRSKKSGGPKKKNIYAGESKSDFVENSEKGSVNWTDQYIEAEGNSVYDTTRFKIKNQAKLMAQRGALVDAQRNLLEIVNGVLVEGQTTVKDLVVVSDDVKTKVSGMLKGAIQVGKTKFEDGVATVKLRIPLYEDGLAEAVDTTTPAVAPPVIPGPVTDSLPKNIVMTVNGEYKPRLFPKLTDAQNQTILDMADSFDPSKGKAPKILRQSKEALDAMKGKKGTELLEVTADKLGNLVLNEKSKARVEKWKKAGLIVWSIVKKLILPI